MDLGASETEIDPGKDRFRRELNELFENRGILADLRSHLRHSMIAALRNTRFGLKPTDKTSPKAQALDLLVAEYLLKRKCHYALSVFTSEVPALSNFSSTAPAAPFRREHPKEETNSFKEKEIEEILNALGLSPCTEQFENVKTKYLNDNEDRSLLEAFIDTFFELSNKLEIRENWEKHGSRDGKSLLPNRWHSKLIDILSREKLKPVQIASVRHSIVSITETELRILTEEARGRESTFLSEREKRIQECIRKRENEILLRLTEAEKNLLVRKNIIDEELSSRQRHLSKMVLEWNDKHEEIVRLSKNFYSIENENKRLREALDELEREKNHLRSQREKQRETINGLRVKVNSLTDRLKEFAESNTVLTHKIETLVDEDDKKFAFDAEMENDGENSHPDGCEPSGQPVVVVVEEGKKTRDRGVGPDVDREVKSNPSDPVKSVFTVKEDVVPPPHSASFNRISCTDDPESIICLSPSSSSEEIVSRARKKLKDLEEESSRIKKNYFEYKLKYHHRSVDADADSDSSSGESTKAIVKEKKDLRESFSQDKNPVATKFSQTSMTENKKEHKSDTEIFVANRKKLHENKSDEISTKKIQAREPNKRQLKNREYFLKSKQLLEEFEKQNADDPRSYDNESSFQLSSSGSLENLRISFGQTETRETSKRSLALTFPQRTGRSFEVAKPNEIESETRTRTVGDREQSSAPAKQNSDCSEPLDKTRIINTPKDSSPRKPLRQQMLLTESEEENDQRSERENKIRIVKNTGSVITPNNTSSSGKVSVGKESCEGGEFW